MSESTRLRPVPTVRPEPLWREVLGRRLRRTRQQRRLTLRQTAARAGISAQYLSEVERGRKEPSSEIVAAIVGALDCTMVDLAGLAVADLRRAHQGMGRHTGPVALAA